jgi:uncharacterized protein (DUF302 family)
VALRANATRSDDPTDQVVTKLSPWSVADTVARLSGLVAAKGMKLFAVIDHSAEAKASGLEPSDTKALIFGSPRAGTPVMQAAPLAALDLPLKVLVVATSSQWSTAGSNAVVSTGLDVKSDAPAATHRRRSPLPLPVMATIGRSADWTRSWIALIVS